MISAKKIVRILSVRDTRQYEEQGDRWVPILGSGTESQCHRCGRLHEVHATVLLDDGSEVVVGTGCAGKDDAEAVKRFASAVSAAKRLKRLEAEMEDYKRRLARWEELWNEVTALPLPPVVEVPLGWVAGRSTPNAKRFSLGESQIVSHSGEVTDERLSCLKDGYWRHRMAERGMTTYPRTKTANLWREIERVRARLEIGIGEHQTKGDL